MLLTWQNNQRTHDRRSERHSRKDMSDLRSFLNDWWVKDLPSNSRCQLQTRRFKKWLLVCFVFCLFVFFLFWGGCFVLFFVIAVVFYFMVFVSFFSSSFLLFLTRSLQSLGFTRRNWKLLRLTKRKQTPFQGYFFHPDE